MSVELYHLTCDHGFDGIRRDNEIRPYAHPLIGGAALVWLTDAPHLPADELGLQSTILSCDRMAHLALVDAPHAVVWRQWADKRVFVGADRTALEFGRSPRHWFVSEQPVLVRSWSR